MPGCRWEGGRGQKLWSHSTCLIYFLTLCMLSRDMAFSQSASYCNEAKLIAMLFSPLELHSDQMGYEIH